MRVTTLGLTGSSGTLGKRIAALLEQQPATRVVNFGGDLRTESDLRQWVNDHCFDTVILSAAVVPVGQASKYPEDTFEINAFSNLKLSFMMQSRYGGTFRICYLSTSHVYAPAPQALTEDSMLRPTTVYGRSKLLGEKFLQSAAEAFGFELLIMRLFSFYAFDQHHSHLYPTLLRRLGRHPNPQTTFELPGWNHVRDFSPADEVARKVVSLATSQLTGVVNVGSGVATTVGDFASQVYGSALKFRDKDASADPTMLVADLSRFTEGIGRYQ